MKIATEAGVMLNTNKLFVCSQYICDGNMRSDQEVYFSTLRENAKVLLDVEKVLQANAKFIGETQHFLRINAKDL